MCQRAAVVQVQDGVPLWMPVSLVSAATSAGNDTAADGVREQRWLEVFAPWEDKHRIAIGGDGVCVEPGTQGGPECGRPLASPPLTVPATNTPWLPKAKAAPFLVSLPDQVCPDSCSCESWAHMGLPTHMKAIMTGHAPCARKCSHHPEQFIIVIGKLQQHNPGSISEPYKF